MRPRRIVESSGAEHCLVVPSPDRAAPRIRTLVDAGLFSWPAECDGDPDSNKRAMRRDGACECLKSRAVEDIRTGSIRRSKKRNLSLFYSFMCLYSLVCTLYALCMHPQLHTFSCSQPYGHAYSRFCMHCMQSIPELCSRIACIVSFLMHTMHTTFRSSIQAMKPTERTKMRTRPQERAMIVSKNGSG